MLPLVAVRATGFEAELVESLASPQSVAAIAPVLAAEREAAAMAERLSVALERLATQAHARGDHRHARQLRRALRRLAAGEPIPAEVVDQLPDGLRADVPDWHAVLVRRDERAAAARERFTSELTDRRQRLRAMVGRPDLQEALLLFSPEAFAAAERYGRHGGGPQRTSRIREVERRLVTYLQRLCLKNETNSFFGPVNYGRIDPASQDNLTWRRRPEGLAERVAFAAHWMVQELADAVGAEPSVRPHLRPRRASGDLPEHTLATVDPVTARLHQLADGRRTLAELAAVLGEPWQQTWPRVERLRDAGALVTGPVIPADVADPLGWLVDWLTGLPAGCAARERWQPVAARLAGLVAEFGTATLNRRRALLTTLETEFQAACGRQARRHGGRMYADRSLLYEECRGDLESVTIGGDLARDVAGSLAPVLRLAESYAGLRWLRDQQAATALWRQLAGPVGGPVPLRDYLRALAARPDSTAAGEPQGSEVDGGDELATFEGELVRLVRERTDGRVARLRGEELPVPKLPEHAAVPRITSLDLMIAAADQAALNRGDYRLVTGEMHAQPLIWAFPTGHFLSSDQRRELAEELHAAVTAGPDPDLVTVIAHTRSSKVYPYPLPGHVVELRPRLPVADAIPVTEVVVRARGQGVCLWADRVGWLRLYPPLRRRRDGLDPVAPFAYPAVELPVVDCGVHTPQVEVDGVVLQRERWVLPGGSRLGRPGDDFDRFRSVWRLKQRVALPDRVFVRVPQERKPVFIDFTNVLLVELFAHLHQMSAHLVVTGMLPDTDQLWLTGGRGRHTCEFRTIAVGAR